MTNSVYNIQPIDVVIGINDKKATKASFSSSYSPFETSMNFGWVLYDTNLNILYMGNGVVNQEQLSKWGDDDEYIVNVMASIAGLTIIW